MHIDITRFLDQLPENTVVLHCGDSCLSPLINEKNQFQSISLNSGSVDELKSEHIHELQSLTGKGFEALVVVDHFPCRVSDYFAGANIAQKSKSADHLIHELIELLEIEDLKSQLSNCALIGAVVDELREEVIDYVELIDA